MRQKLSVQSYDEEQTEYDYDEFIPEIYQPEVGEPQPIDDKLDRARDRYRDRHNKAKLASKEHKFATIILQEQIKMLLEQQKMEVEEQLALGEEPDYDELAEEVWNLQSEQKYRTMDKSPRFFNKPKHTSKYEMVREALALEFGDYSDIESDYDSEDDELETSGLTKF